jgi:hypothetical protein
MLAFRTKTERLQVCACIIRTNVLNASMNTKMLMLERPTCIPAGGAFLCSEAWQSGLLHRAYPSADVWASNPLTASREFEPHRFHHQTSGPVAVEAAPSPDLSPRDWAPKQSIWRNIVLSPLPCQRFQSPNMTDWAHHEFPLPRKANRDHCRAL